MTSIQKLIDEIFPALIKSRTIKCFGYNENDSARDEIVKKHLEKIALLNYKAMFKSSVSRPVNQSIQSIRNYLYNPIFGNILQEFDEEDEQAIKIHLKGIAILEFTSFIEGYLSQSDEEEMDSFGTDNIVCDSYFRTRHSPVDYHY